MASFPAEKYTVGWICAIPTELRAAKAMLDTTHGPLRSQPKHDENNYTLGRIGEHNVVLACLPRYGTTDAAVAGKSMQSTFSNLRFGLMVGVGGGIPSPDNDIRLGDIVVSVPDGQAGGVIQYDMGKEEDGGFRRVGFLNSPPTLLLTAIANLRSIRKLGSDVTNIVNKAFPEDGDDDEKEEWRFPANARDILFEEYYGDSSEGFKVVERKSRKSSNPRCFFGNIGSGNKVIKSANERRRLVEEEKILCFEMEASGLMNFFKCIVIRGICDYADSHKCQEWQPYAASVAAAFAKKLLSVISAHAVENLEPIKKNQHWIVPRQVSTHFTGRTDILREMREKLCTGSDDSSQNEQKRFVISAMGGSGKSEVCLKFAHDNKESFWGVFWIDASDEASLKRDFVGVAKRAGNENVIEYEEARTWLENCNKSWLLIFDNADNEQVDYFKFFPSGNSGSILMSTRISDCAQDYNTAGFQNTDFEKLGIEDSIELLLKCANVPQDKRGDVEDDARQMVGDHILCQHALAITQAGAFIKKNLSTFKEYPILFQKQRKELLEYHQKQAQSRYGDVYATFEVSAEAMENSEQSDWKNALELLKALAFLHREGVKEEIFTRAWATAIQTAEEPNDGIRLCSLWHVNYMRKILLQTQNSPQELDLISLRKARSVLHSFSLITVDSDTGDISMHPLVHAWAKDRLEADTRINAWKITASILRLSIGNNNGYSEFFDRIQSHVESCFNARPEHLFDNSKLTSLEIDRILYSFTWVMHRLQNHRLAKDVSDMIYSRIGHEISPQSRQWREVMYLQSVCLYYADKYDEVLDSVEKVVLYDKEYSLLEDDEPADALDLLGRTCQKLGKDQQAIELLENVSQIRQESLPLTDRLCVDASDKLASAHLNIGLVDKAIKLLEEVVQIQRETLASTHPYRLGSEHELGRAYLENKQVDKALKLLEEVVQIRGETLASTHPYRLGSEHELGRAYLENKQVDKALKLLEEVVQIRGKTLASTNPSRLASEHELGRAYLQNKQVDKALKLFEEVVQFRRKTLASAHPSRLASEHMLALAYYENEDYQKALPLIREVAAIRSEILDVGDEYRVQTEDLLSYCLQCIEQERSESGSDEDTQAPSV